MLNGDTTVSLLPVCLSVCVSSLPSICQCQDFSLSLLKLFLCGHFPVEKKEIDHILFHHCVLDVDGDSGPVFNPQRHRMFEMRSYSQAFSHHREPKGEGDGHLFKKTANSNAMRQYAINITTTIQEL